MESYNYFSSNIVVDRMTPPMISAPIPRRQIAFEQDSKMSPPQERKHHPELASDQIKAGNTMDLDSSDKEETKSLEEDYKDPESMWIGRITNDKSTLLGEPHSFSGKREDTMRWLMVMKAYFKINHEFYDDKKMIIIVFLSKMTKGRAGTFTKG